MKKRVLTIALALVMLLATVAIIPVSAATPETPEVLGASIRIEGTQGLRFVGKIKKADYSLTFGESANFGILLIPESKVEAGTPITAATPGVVKVPAKILLHPTTVANLGIDYDSNYYYFTAVQTGIPAEYYGTNMIARVYIYNSGSYTYSALQLKRSVKYVADAVVAAGGEIPAGITKALSDYDAVGADILVDGSKFGLMVDPATIALDKYYI